MAIQLNFKCNESWNQMETNDTGRFCGKCAKNVFDLTDKSESEIEKLYKENNGKLCGRLRTTQLYTPGIKRRRYALAQFCVALFFAFGSMLFSYELNGQTIQHKDRGYAGDIASDSLQWDYRNQLTKKEENQLKDANGVAIVRDVAAQSNRIVAGVVTDEETGELLPFVSVVMKYEDQIFGTTTDFDGKYKIVLPSALTAEDTLTVHFAYVGYGTTKLEGVSFREGEEVLEAKVNMKMQPQYIEMGMVIIVDPPIISKDPEKQGVTEFSSEDIRRSPY